MWEFGVLGGDVDVFVLGGLIVGVEDAASSMCVDSRSFDRRLVSDFVIGLLLFSCRRFGLPFC